ncbi:MAG TPA: SpoIIE family protein phosphatase [Solirubrobacteraceae bacterium]|jgi:PAS domain S-box-containing protein
MEDVRGTARREPGIDLLVEAGAALASSLDPRTTMREVAKLTVPRLADICVIDLLDDDGKIKDVAVIAADVQIARGLEALRAEHPLNPGGAHPVAKVIRSGQPELLAVMADRTLRTFAQGSEHARFMIEHGYRSAIVAPLRARERTLGALSVLRLGEHEPFDPGDLDLVCELARRAALAIDNARLFSDLQQVEQRLEAVLVNLAEAITVADEHGQMVFANQAAADLLGAATPSELTSAAPGTIWPRFEVLDEQGRELDLESMPGRRLFSGEVPEPLLVRNIVRATGEERWLVVRSSPVTDPETGRILYAVNVFENITEVKRAQLAEHYIAHTLQRALLPESLPEIPGAGLEALYHAAGELNDVGGDFYDVFAYGEDRWMLVIGDVCGKGPRAAGVTALARHTLRAAAISGQSPVGMLSTLHEALLRQPPGADLCTVCLVMLTRVQDGARLTIVLAGHPPPLLISAGAEVEQAGLSGTVLGVVDPVSIEESEITLSAGETLLLYTDGVIEAGRPDHLLGEEGLLELCTAAPNLPLEGFLEHIELAALTRAQGRLRDDIALLALRIEG